MPKSMFNITVLVLIILSILTTALVYIYYQPEPIPGIQPAPKKQPKLTKADYILVEKSKRLMSVYFHNQLQKTYKIALGRKPVGAKTQEGDSKTPEGIYKISGKNPRSKYHLGLLISYPNSIDKKNAAAKKVSPGCDILIHGLNPVFSYIGSLHTNYDWTQGCIAVTDPEIEELYAVTAVGTTIEIRP